MLSQGTCEAKAEVDSLNTKKVMAMLHIMTLCVPEVKPEVRFEKPKCPTRARKKFYEMLKFHCDEIIGEGYSATQEKKKEEERRNRERERGEHSHSISQ
jgi:hypothetical protein